jgi:predicted phosphodiesterase
MKIEKNFLSMFLIDMRIQYVSDLHLEFYNKLPENLLKPDAEVLCIAGDVGYPYSSIYEDFLQVISSNFRKVFLITGNHEYYNARGNRHHTMEEIEERIRQIIRDLKLNNITFLDNEFEDFEGYRFVGSTLWSKCEKPVVDYCVNDFRVIKEMSVDLYNELHEVSREFLKSSIVTESSLPVIVITHHLPSFQLIADEYKDCTGLNKYFASKSDDLFVSTIKVWIYGHTHIKSDRMSKIGIRFACNPLGYPGETKGLSLTKTIDL